MTTNIIGNALQSQLIGVVAISAYGGISNSADVSVSDITSTFQTLSGLDTGNITSPKNIAQDTINDGLSFDISGVFNLSGHVSLTFVEVNAGRTIELRFFNVTAGVPIGTTGAVYFVGRNQGGVSMPFNLTLDVEAAHIGDLIVLQVASAVDTFTIVNNISTILQANAVSELTSL